MKKSKIFTSTRDKTKIETGIEKESRIGRTVIPPPTYRKLGSTSTSSVRIPVSLSTSAVIAAATATAGTDRATVISNITGTVNSNIGGTPSLEKRIKKREREPDLY
jgi:hypothetical protein